jgi:glyoxylase-like metal-dependent hydrolase (beta-lactamase superfamily II)/rhodanese-related sulfurtransferase
MIFEQIPTGGCRSYLLGSSEARAAIVIDPNLHQLDRYTAIAARHGLRIRYVLDTHTHADHFSAAKELGQRLGALVVTHHLSPARHAELRLEDGDLLKLGDMELRAMHTPGHTRDSMCVLAGDRIFTGDTLLIGSVGRTDLPSGDPDELYDSLFGRVLKLDPALKVYPAHDYKGREYSTLGEELATNPRLNVNGRSAFVAMMRALHLEAPEHLSEALRTNISGGKPVAQLLETAADKIAFVSVEELAAHPANALLLDVREREAFGAGHISGALSLPRGQLEWEADRQLPDPDRHILVYCEDGQAAILAAAALKELGFSHVAALAGGLRAWREKAFPICGPEIIQPLTKPA